jgi:hypothetical protein
MYTLIVLLLVFLIVLAIIGLVAIQFLFGYRRLAAAQGGRPHRFAAYKTDNCQHVPAHIYKRPDPMIYSQQYLMSKGLAVTWDNPDIHLELGGVPVDSHDLKPNTTYDVIARIWNNSLDAVVVNMPVEFSYLSFGIGTTKTHIETTAVDVGVKGAPGCPAFARVPWTTPTWPLLSVSRVYLGRRRQSVQQCRPAEYGREAAQLAESEVQDGCAQFIARAAGDCASPRHIQIAGVARLPPTPRNGQSATLARRSGASTARNRRWGEPREIPVAGGLDSNS